MPPDVPRLVRVDRARQARFQALYRAETAVVGLWRAWGWAKLIAGLLAWLWAR